MKNFKSHLFFSNIIIFLITMHAASAAPKWQSNSALLLHGNDYVVDADKQTTLTLEHASEWSKGDVFAFVDLT